MSAQPGAAARTLTPADMEAGLAARGIPVGRLISGAGLGRSTWSDWRAGRTRPRPDRWAAVTAAFDTLVAEAVPAPAAAEPEASGNDPVLLTGSSAPTGAPPRFTPVATAELDDEILIAGVLPPGDVVSQSERVRALIERDRAAWGALGSHPTTDPGYDRAARLDDACTLAIGNLVATPARTPRDLAAKASVILTGLGNKPSEWYAEAGLLSDLVQSTAADAVRLGTNSRSTQTSPTFVPVVTAAGDVLVAATVVNGLLPHPLGLAPVAPEATVTDLAKRAAALVQREDRLSRRLAAMPPARYAREVDRIGRLQDRMLRRLWRYVRRLSKLPSPTIRALGMKGHAYIELAVAKWEMTRSRDTLGLSIARDAFHLALEAACQPEEASAAPARHATGLLRESDPTQALFAEAKRLCAAIDAGGSDEALDRLFDQWGEIDRQALASPPTSIAGALAMIEWAAWEHDRNSTPQPDEGDRLVRDMLGAGLRALRAELPEAPIEPGTDQAFAGVSAAIDRLRVAQLRASALDDDAHPDDLAEVEARDALHALEAIAAELAARPARDPGELAVKAKIAAAIGGSDRIEYEYLVLGHQALVRSMIDDARRLGAGAATLGPRADLAGTVSAGAERVVDLARRETSALTRVLDREEDHALRPSARSETAMRAADRLCSRLTRRLRSTCVALARQPASTPADLAAKARAALAVPNVTESDPWWVALRDAVVRDAAALRPTSADAGQGAEPGEQAGPLSIEQAAAVDFGPFAFDGWVPPSSAEWSELGETVLVTMRIAYQLLLKDKSKVVGLMADLARVPPTELNDQALFERIDGAVALFETFTTVLSQARLRSLYAAAAAALQGEAGKAAPAARSAA